MQHVKDKDIVVASPGVTASVTGVMADVEWLITCRRRRVTQVAVMVGVVVVACAEYIFLEGGLQGGVVGPVLSGGGQQTERQGA